MKVFARILVLSFLIGIFLPPPIFAQIDSNTSNLGNVDFGLGTKPTQTTNNSDNTNVNTPLESVNFGLGTGSAQPTNNTTGVVDQNTAKLPVNFGLSNTQPVNNTENTNKTGHSNGTWSGYKPLQPVNLPNGKTLFNPDITSYLQNIYSFGIAIAGALAVIVIVVAGIEYMVSDAFTVKADAIGRIKAAFYGLGLALGSYVLLYTISPELVKLKFNLTPVSAPGVSSGGSLVTGSGGAGSYNSSGLPGIDTSGVNYASGPGNTIIGSGEANIDFDLSPGAYKVTEVPEGTDGAIVINGKSYISSGYENLSNAGGPGNWYGVQTDSSGNPIINSDGTINGAASNARAVGTGDTEPFVALTNQQLSEIRKTDPNFGLGSTVLVTNQLNGVTVEAKYQDNGGNQGMNHTEIGPVTATALGVSYGKNSKGTMGATGNLTFSLPNK